MSLHATLQSWRDAFGHIHIDGPEQAQARYGRDTTCAERNLLGAVRVSNAEQVQVVIAATHLLNIPVHAISTGKNWGYGSALPSGQDCLLLDMGAMKGIDLDVEHGVVTVEPGVTQGDLARYLDEHPLGPLPFLVPVTGAGPTTSLLANALERGYGVTPMVDHFSAVTNLEAIMADGTPYKTMLCEAGTEELARLFRWGLGPFSMGLFTQSGFGVVTRMSILLARRPETVCVGLFGVAHEHQLGAAVEAIRDIVQQLPGVVGAINLMNAHRVLSMSAPYPWDSLDGHGLIPEDVLQAMRRQYQVMPWTGFCTLYGKASIVKAAQREIRSRLRGIASRLMFVTPERAELFHRLSHYLPGRLGHRLQSLTGTLRKSLDLVSGRPNETALPLAYWRCRSATRGQTLDPAKDGSGLLWYAPLVPMTARDAADYADMIRQVVPSHGMEPLITFTTLSDRLFDSTVPLLFDPQQPGTRDRARSCYEELMKKGQEKHYFPYRLPIDAMPLLRDFAPEATEFHDRLARAFDPTRRLAPGRYY